MPASHTRQWWLAGGIHPSQVVAAYQPKGAVDLAASYVNLANPGTYNAAPGVAPTLDSNGWGFNGTSQYISTGFPFARNNSALIVFEMTGSAYNMLCGANSNQAGGYFYIKPAHLTLYRQTYANGGSNAVDGDALSGVIGICGGLCVLNGSVVTTLNPGVVESEAHVFIGAQNSTGVANSFISARISAAVFYNSSIQPSQIAALSAAMAAL